MNDIDRKVNIQCSVGFYEAVAKPSLSGLSRGYRQQVAGVDIHCTLIRNTQDMSYSVSSFFLRFELSGPGVLPDPAPLSVHLHHTQRRVQVQGGGTMPDKSRAAVWFVDNVLKQRFVK